MMKYQTDYIEEIDSLFEKRNSLLPLKNEDEIRLQKKYRLEFNYNSNHIEGNTLTYGQTQLLLLFDKSSGDVQMSDLEEMKAHDVALKMIHEMAQDGERPLTELFIKELNKLILVRNFWKEAITSDGIATRKEIIPGEYKSSPNSVRLRNGEIHHYASPEETPAEMNGLLDWYRANESKMHPVQLAAEFHYRFVCIHPFDDGNGRVARLIMNYILLRFNYPIIIIKSKDKENYLTALQKADVGDKQAIIEYLEKQMLWSLDLELKAANGEDLEEDDDIDKEIELLKREKLEKPILHRTPMYVDEIIIDFHFEKFIVISNFINKFIEFFAGSELDVNCYYLKKNDVSEVIKLKNVEVWKDEVSEKIGFNEIYKPERINSFVWNYKLLALQSIKNRLDISLQFTLRFKESGYAISVKCIESNRVPRVGEGMLFNSEFLYKRLIGNSTITTISKDISRKIIEIISNYK